jgi:hypothetical protein
MTLFKQCNICRQEKTSSEFSPMKSCRDGLSVYCKSCACEYNKKRYKNNPEPIKQQALKWARENRPHVYTVQKQWMKNNPIGRIRKNILKRTNLKTSEACPIGCSGKELKKYLESQFTTGISWENYGKDWGVVRKKKIVEFDLSDPIQRQQVNHYSNLIVEKKVL